MNLKPYLCISYIFALTHFKTGRSQTTIFTVEKSGREGATVTYPRLFNSSDLALNTVLHKRSAVQSEVPALIAVDPFRR